MSNKLNESSTLNFSNDLSLSAITFPKLPKNNVVSEELNTYLRDQLEQTKRENATLQQDLSEKGLQLQQKQTTIEKLTEKLGAYEFASTPQLANNKIMELSKKLREKNSEVEVLKSKCSGLEATLSELKLNQEKVVEVESKLEPVETDPGEIKKLQEKLNTTTNKWIEEKNLNLKLKNDLKRANKWLQQEVGDKFETLLSLNSSNSNWRGRAQIICDLQQKNQELKDKLKIFEEKKQVSNTDLNKNKYEKKIDELKEENSELKNRYTDLKRKFDALKARCKVLENDQGILKTKLNDLGEIHEMDQQTIAKLTSQLQHYSQLKTEDLKQKDQLLKSLQQENESLKVELMREKCVSEKKSKELVEKLDDIQILNKRIRSARPTSSYTRRHEAPTSDLTVNNQSETKTINRLEVERLRLLELTEIQNTRLEEERNAHLKTQHLLRAEKQKSTRLEANLKLSELEQNSARSGYSSKSTSRRLEFDVKDKLELAEENIKALTTRLEIECLERKKDFQEFTKILKNCNCNMF